MAYTEIGSARELRDLLGVPTGRAVTKERTRLHAVDREWLAISPFCILATSDADGNCDASPKGDPAGHLVHVLDDTTVAIAERPGNRRADGYGNILANPHIGIISMIPGRNETLRINGRARLEAIKHVLLKFDYDGKDPEVIGEPDKALIGPPAVMSEHDPDLVFPEL